MATSVGKVNIRTTSLVNFVTVFKWCKFLNKGKSTFLLTCQHYKAMQSNFIAPEKRVYVNVTYLINKPIIIWRKCYSYVIQEQSFRDVLRKRFFFHKIHRKIRVLESLSTKVAGLKRDSSKGVSLSIFRNTLFLEHFRWLLLVIALQLTIKCIFIRLAIYIKRELVQSSQRNTFPWHHLFSSPLIVEIKISST